MAAARSLRRSPVRLRRPRARGRAASSGARNRANDGYRLGWGHGYWYGKCEAVIRQAKPVPVMRPIHVMYVTTGKGYPYSPLDHAMTQTLQALAERVTIASPEQDIASIVAANRPDLLVALDGMNLQPHQVHAARNAGVRTSIWFTDDPYYTDVTGDLAVHYDTVFTLERNCVPFYQERGCPRVHYLPLGVFPEAFRPSNPPLETRCDIRFIGTAYWNRVDLFHRLLPLLAHRHVQLSGMWWDRLPDYARWAKSIELGKWMGPEETSMRYNGARIVINVHRAHDDETFNRNRAMIAAASPNPRTFEIAASGSLQLCDVREDLGSFYVPGQEIVTFDSPEDLAAKAEYYLHHEEERQRIALQALYRTLRDHTYVSRVNQLIDASLAP